MQETLRLDITADNKEAIAVLKQTDAALLKVGTTSTKVGAAVAKSSNQAGNALTNLGRVAQDAPYGFIGIQNNLNPLLESFQRLKADSGSTGGALKAMAAGLMGPAGLGIALSVGSALLLTFGDKLFGVKEKTEQTNKASEEYTRKLKEQSDEATRAIVSVSNLVAAGISEQASLKQKKEILKELNKISSQYFGGLKIEKGEITGLVQAYQMYAENLYKVARAKGAAQQVEELSNQLLKSTTRVKDLTDKLTTLNNVQSLVGGPKAAAKKFDEIDGILGKVLYSQEDIQRISELTGIQESKVNNLLSQSLKSKTEELRLTAQILDLSKFANQETLTGLTDTKEKAKKEFDILKYRQKMAGLMAESLFPAPAVFEKPVDQKMSDSTLPTTTAELDKILTDARLANMAKIRKQKEDDTKYDEEHILKQADMYMSVLSPAIDSLFTSLANGENVVENLGNMFSELTKQIVISLAKTAALAGIISLLSGGKISFGTAFKGLQGFADGGIASGPKSGYPALLHGTEAILNPGQFKNLTSNMMNMGAMQGKSNDSSGFVASTSIRGSEMLLMIKRAEANMGLKRG